MLGLRSSVPLDDKSATRRFGVRVNSAGQAWITAQSDTTIKFLLGAVRGPPEDGLFRRGTCQWWHDIGKCARIDCRGRGRGRKWAIRQAWSPVLQSPGGGKSRTR